MDAGLHLFAQRGFDGSSVGQIAEYAGVNKALISYYFQGKRGLQDAIHSESLQMLVPRIQKLPDPKSTASEDLCEFIRALTGLSGAKPEYPVMLLRGLIAGETDPEGEFATRVLEINKTLAAILNKGVRGGCFRSVDPVLTQVSILGSLLFFFATDASRRRMANAGKLKLPSTDQFIEHIQELFVSGITATRD